MLLSRFWYLLLAVAVGLLLAVTSMAQSAFSRQLDRHMEDQLRRDRYEVELVLKTLAREQIDSINGVAGHSDVKKSLRAAGDKAEAIAEQRDLLSKRLQVLNEQLDEFAGDLLFAVSKNGTIVGAVGTDSLPQGASLGGYPLVKRALSGYLRDDAWLWNGSIYRMAARPVVDGGEYIGAVVHGMKINPEFTKRLSTRVPGATIGFFVGNQIVASHMAPSSGARAEDLAAPLEEVLKNPNLAAGNPTQAIPLASGRARGIYSLMTGAAAEANVGYTLSRPDRVAKGEGSLLQHLDFQKDGGATTLAIVALPTILVGFLIALGFLFLEHDRPTRRLAMHANELAEGALDRFDPAQFGGRYRKATELTNRALDRVAESGAAATKPADLNEVLGASQPEANAPAFFGFANREDGISSDIPPPPPAAASTTEDATAADELPAPPPAPPTESAPAEPSLAADSLHPEPSNSHVIPTPVAPPPSEAVAAGQGQPPFPLNPPPDRPAWASGTLLGVGAVPEAEGAVPPPPPSSSRPDSRTASAFGDVPPISPPEFQEEEGQTLVKQIPQELLDAVTNGAESRQAEEEAHFQSIFEEFVATKRQCGENTAGLTFEKFRRTLEKNRRQIVTRHGASRVRFTVYVKAGKAALKATPIK